MGHISQQPRIGQPFSIVAKPAGAKCNLDCTYCFYLEKDGLYPDAKVRVMADDVLERYISGFIHSQPGDVVSFVWQGGEPTLLGVNYYRRVLKLQKKYAGNKTIENAFQTNGVLLDDEWCKLFKDGNFLVGLSVDGPEDLHDACRVNKGGAGTFKQVMRGLEYLLKHDVAFNTLTILHSDNADDPLRTYRFLKTIGSRFLQFIPIVERISVAASHGGLSLVSPTYTATATISNWSLTAGQYGNFLVSIFDEWVRHDVGRVFVQLFDSTLSFWLGYGAESCIFQKTCGRGVALEHNGDLYSCDHYVYPDYRLGNIMESGFDELVFGSRQLQFGQDKEETLPSQCLSCEVLPLCNGGCPKHRVATTKDCEPGLNHFCSAYWKFFTHARPFMEVMAQEIRNNVGLKNITND